MHLQTEERLDEEEEEGKRDGGREGGERMRRWRLTEGGKRWRRRRKRKGMGKREEGRGLKRFGRKKVFSDKRDNILRKSWFFKFIGLCLSHLVCT